MHRFFTEEINSSEQLVRLTGQDAAHAARVLRLEPGDQILVGAGDGRDYTCRIKTISPEEVTAAIEDISGNTAELPVEITLYQGFPKGDKMDLILQKTVELGVFRVVPVWMSRSVVKMDDAKAKKRRERYQSIAEAAAKQSGRGVVPEVGTFLSMKDAIQDAAKLDRVFVPYENAGGMDRTRALLEKLREDSASGAAKSLGVFIGPEGGFEESEISALKEIGAEVITLGHRILRTETAAMALLAVLGYIFEKD